MRGGVEAVVRHPDDADGGVPRGGVNYPGLRGERRCTLFVYMIPLGNFAFWLLGAAAFGIWFSGGLLAATDLSEDEGWRGTLLERTWLVCFAILALAAVLLTVGFVGAAVWAVLRAVFG